MSDDYITTREFGQWAASIDRRLDKIDKHGETLTSIEVHLAVLNGRTSANTEKIGAVERQIADIATEDGKIEDVVTDIQQHGCHQLREHEAAVGVLEGAGVVLNRDGPPARHPWSPRTWSPKAKVAAGAGVTALVIPAISDLFKLGVALVGWLQQIHGRVP